jgi:aspartyl-tRNA(Asn)/glutamyl-tRNA(Gln) amidotransferase subunit C
MSITVQDVTRIANLARIDVPEAEKPHLAGQLSGMLKFIEQLNEVNTDGVEPMTTAAKMKLPRREDKVTDGNYAADLLANAPEATGNFFVVPKVIE